MHKETVGFRQLTIVQPLVGRKCNCVHKKFHLEAQNSIACHQMQFMSLGTRLVLAMDYKIP